MRSGVVALALIVLGASAPTARALCENGYLPDCLDDAARTLGAPEPSPVVADARRAADAAPGTAAAAADAAVASAGEAVEDAAEEAEARRAWASGHHLAAARDANRFVDEEERVLNKTAKRAKEDPRMAASYFEKATLANAYDFRTRLLARTLA